MKKIAFLILLLVACNNPQKPEPKEEPLVEDSTKTTQTEDSLADNSEEIKKMPIDPNLSPKDRARVEEIINKQYLMGKFDPSRDGRFTKIPSKYLVEASHTVFMRTEALEKFIEMHTAALKEGISLKIRSATRPFNIQKEIWERKWQGKQQVNGYFIPDSLKGKDRALRILEWNSMPSTSRHHWGTDIDINNVDPSYWAQPLGKKQYDWLVANANKYGFCQVYSKMDARRPVGYQEEKWHWSYIPIARELVKEYKAQVKNGDISGFLGAETAEDIKVVESYVLGINPDCQ